MATEPTTALIARTPVAAPNRAAAVYTTALDYWALTKPEVNFLILITTFVAFHLASSSGAARILTVIHTLVGTLLVASGAATLNQFSERSFDAKMRRTARRPLAAGRLRPSNVLWFGISLSVAGVLSLAAINALTALIGLLTLLSYLFVYTPLKRKTALCTFVGAFPGAAPPLIGWAAARGRIDAEAWVLYLIVFLWQFPHFMAIAWMYREDYMRAGYRVLPQQRLRNRFVTWQSSAFSLALAPVALIPAIVGYSGAAYSVGAAVLSLAFLYFSGRFAFCRTNTTAKQLLVSSVFYLPLLFTLLMFDKK
ncbi:MAG: heme o synthase [Candidatus Acidiferrales bacterium]